MAALLSKYGVARHIYIPVIKRAVVDFAVGADWSPAAGDVKISKDGGAAANVTNLPSAIVMGNTAMWDFSLTATEMQAAQVMVSVADSATKVVEDQFIIIETYGNAAGQHEMDLDTPTINPGAAGITNASFAAGAINAAAIASAAITLAKYAAGAIDNTVLATDAIGSSQIAADAIGSSELAAGAASEIATAVWATAMSDIAAVPAISGSALSALNWLFVLARNRRKQTATTETVYKDDATTAFATSTKSDDGTTLERGEYA